MKNPIKPSTNKRLGSLFPRILYTAALLALGALVCSASQNEDLDKAKEQILYSRVQGRDMVADCAFVLRKNSGRTKLEASILATGQGAEYRHWIPQRPILLTTSGSLLPVSSSPYNFAAKSSPAAGAAPLVFAAIGSQYERDAYKAQQNPGSSCPTTSSSGSSETKQGRISKTVDRAGMAAGMGLLASQAKGQISGERVTFDVTGLEKGLCGASMNFEVRNDSAHRQENIAVPVNFCEAPSWKNIQLTGAKSKLLAK